MSNSYLEEEEDDKKYQQQESFDWRIKLNFKLIIFNFRIPS